MPKVNLKKICHNDFITGHFMSALAHGLAVGTILSMGCVADTLADTYPNRPVRLIVGFPAGGVSDFMARTLGQKLSVALSTPFVIDNRPGAGTVIASDITAKAPADGYTLFMAGTTFSLTASLQAHLPFDPIKDFAGIGLVSIAPQVLVAYTGLPVKNMNELMNLAKTQPGVLNFASSGTGSTSHLAGELFNHMAHIQLTHIPYKGGSSAMMTDLLAGRVQVLFLSLTGALPQIKARRVNPIAVTSKSRARAVPEVPTFNESGIPGYEAVSWNGLMAPKATPRVIIKTLNQQINKILTTPELIELLQLQGAEPQGGSEHAFEQYVKNDISKWKDLIQSTSIKAE
jgi:hypothetical protein